MMVDVVAEAICNTYYGDIEAWECIYSRDRDNWRRVAEAAIDALQTTPTPLLDAVDCSGALADLEES